MAKIIESSVNKYEPHRIIYYLYDLATLFHGYWSKGNENKKYRLIIDGKIKNESLIILKLVSIVIKNGMDIIEFPTAKNVMNISKIFTVIIFFLFCFFILKCTILHL